MTNQLTQADAERLYLELGVLAKDPPNLGLPEDAEVQQWLGRAHAIVLQASGNGFDAIDFSVCSDNLTSAVLAERNRVKIMNIIFRTLAYLERKAPASSANAFIGAGETFNALTSLRKVFAECSKCVLFIDPYAAANLLADYAIQAPEGVTVQVLAGKGQIRPDLRPTVQAWVTQYGGSRPLEVRLAEKGTLHDRAVFIDDKAAWTIGTSFNGLARNSPTLLQKVDKDEVFPDKLEAYRKIWNTAEAFV